MLDNRGHFTSGLAFQLFGSCFSNGGRLWPGLIEAILQTISFADTNWPWHMEIQPYSIAIVMPTTKLDIHKEDE